MIWMNENITFTKFLKESQSLSMIQCLYKLLLKTLMKVHLQIQHSALSPCTNLLSLIGSFLN